MWRNMMRSTKSQKALVLDYSIDNNPQTCNRWKYSKTKGNNSGDETM